jgi:hypothetical protein
LLTACLTAFVAVGIVAEREETRKANGPVVVADRDGEGIDLTAVADGGVHDASHFFPADELRLHYHRITYTHAEVCRLDEEKKKKREISVRRHDD